MRRARGSLIFCILLVWGLTTVQGEGTVGYENNEMVKLQTKGSGWYADIEEFKVTSYNIDSNGILLNAVFKDFKDRDDQGSLVTLIDNKEDIIINWKNNIIGCDNQDIILKEIQKALEKEYGVNITPYAKLTSGHFMEMMVKPTKMKDYVIPIYIPVVRVKGCFKVTTYDKYGGRDTKWIECEGEAIIPIDRGAAISLVCGQVVYKDTEEYNTIKDSFHELFSIMK